jgi:hypothetical protein
VGAELRASETGEFCVQLDASVGAEWARHSSVMRGSVKARPVGDNACDDCSVLGDWGVTPSQKSLELYSNCIKAD